MGRRRTAFDWPPTPARRRLGGTGRRAGGLAAGAIGLAALLAALAVVRLSQGPVPLPWLAPLVAEAVAAELGEGRFELGEAALVIGGTDGPAPALRLSRVSFRDAEGLPALSAPEVLARFRPLDLLSGRLRLSSVAVPGARAALRRDETGRFGLALDAVRVGEAEAGDAPAGGLAGLLEARDGPLASLTEIDLPGLRLRVEDAGAPAPWPVAAGDVRLQRRGDAVTATAALAWPGGLRAAGDVAATAQTLRLRLRFEIPDVAALAPHAADATARAALAAVEAPLTGAVEARLSPDGALRSVTGSVELGAGALSHGGGAPLALDAARAAFAWDPALGALTVRDVEMAGPAGAFSAEGEVRPGDGRPTVDLRLSRLSVAHPGLFAAPAAFEGGALTARLDPAARAIEIATASLRRGTLTLEARGRLSGGATGFSGDLTARLTGAGADDLVALWPLGLGDGAREWLAENLEAGVVESADLGARFGPEGEAVDLSFAFRDGVAHYLRPLPPIEGAAGWGWLTENRFALALTKGRVAAPGGGTTDLAGSSFAVPDLADPDSRADVAVVGEGPIPAILEVLDMPPLGFVRQVGLAPRAVAGRARATAALSLPLVEDLGLDQVAVVAEAALSDVDLIAPGVERRLTADALALTADVGRLTLAGDATLAGAPLRLALTETFAPATGRPRTEIALAGPVTAAQSADLGVDLGPRVTGRAAVEARLELFAGGAMDFAVDADLRGVAVEGAPLPWRKPAETAGEARVSGRLDGQGLRLSALEGAAADLFVRGNATLTTGGDLRALRLDAARLGGVADLALDLARGDEGWRLNAQGPLLDLGAFSGQTAADASEPGAPAGGDGEADAPPFTARARVGELRATDRLTFRDADLDASRGRDGALMARIDGRLGAGDAMAFLGYADRAGARDVRFAAEDAGAALRALGVFRRGVGGALEAEAAAAPGADWRGELRIADLAVTDGPGLGALLEGADLDAARAQLRDDGLRFDAIRAPFALRGDRVTVADAVATGPTIGLSISGAIDVADGTLDLEGVFTPAYGVNSLLGDLPVFGPLFTGGEGQGLIGFTFAMNGPAEAPDVRVNPFSGLLPGALRNLARPSREGVDAAQDREDWRRRIERMR